MFGSLSSRVTHTLFQVVLAMSFLVAAQAQAQSIVGAWTKPGLTMTFQSDGRWTRYADDAARLTHCGGPETGGGTYTAAAGSISLVDEGGWCSFNYTLSLVQTGTYTLSANTLVMHLQGSPDGPMDLTLSAQAQAQAQSIVGTWTTQGRDWVWILQANGRGVIVGTGVKASCSGISSQSGTYTASAGSLILVRDPNYGCNGDAFPQGPGNISANYIISGSVLALNNISDNSQNIGSLALTSVPAQTGSLVGAWTMQGLDWVWNFKADGQVTLAGTHLGPSSLPKCVTAGSWLGTYSASAGNLTFSPDTWTCEGTSVSGVGFAGQGRYAFTGSSVTFFYEKTAGQNVGVTTGFILNPQGGATTPSVTPTTPLPPPPTVQTVYTAPTGQMPTAAVSVSPSGTFGNATLAVTLDLSKVLSGGSFAGSGQYAAGYSIYVVALVPKGVLGLPAAAMFVLPASRVWTPLGSPIAAYMDGLAQNATDKVVISILSGMDVTGLVGTEIYIGYGTGDTEMLAANRYRGVYKVQ